MLAQQNLFISEFITFTSPLFVSDWTVGCILLVCSLCGSLLFLYAWSIWDIIYSVDIICIKKEIRSNVSVSLNAFNTRSLQ